MEDSGEAADAIRQADNLSVLKTIRDNNKIIGEVRGAAEDLADQLSDLEKLIEDLEVKPQDPNDSLP